MNWPASKDELAVIRKIADRAVALAESFGVDYASRTATMDISATHANGNPLDLDGLLKSDDGNFAHDVFGIRRHINRSTGKLEDCFVPRYTLRS